MSFISSIVLTFAIFCTHEFEASSTRNIAVKQPIYAPCEDVSSRNNLITDGISSPMNSLLVSSDCSEAALVRIKIVIPPTKMIGSVIVFSGECSDCDSMLDNFNVQMTPHDNPSIVIECGQFAGEFLAPGMPMRVNCNMQQFWNQLISEITIRPSDGRSKSSTKAAISEIEVYQMEYSRDLGYYGCYSEFSGKLTKVTDGTCKLACFRAGNRFMSLRSDGSCLCGSKAPTNLLEDTECPSPCKTEFDIMCGSKNTHSVYIARAPHIYIVGCYKSTVPSGAIEKDDMSVPFCIRECAREGKVNALLQNSSYCFCEDEISNPPVNFELCNLRCSGQDVICGGDNEALIFSGCIDAPDETPCQEIYKCPSENFDEFGLCLDYCEDDWFGKYCLSRDIPVVPKVTDAVTVKTTHPRIKPVVGEGPRPGKHYSTKRGTSRQHPSRPFEVPQRHLGSKSDIDMSIFNAFDITPECIQSIIVVLPNLAEISRSAAGGSCIPSAAEAFDADEDNWAYNSNLPLREVGFYFFVTTLGFSGFGVIIGYYIWSLPSGPPELKLWKILSRKFTVIISKPPSKILE